MNRNDAVELLVEVRQAVQDLPALLEAPNPQAAIKVAVESIEYRLALIQRVMT